MVFLQPARIQTDIEAHTGNLALTPSAVKIQRGSNCWTITCDFQPFAAALIATELDQVTPHLQSLLPAIGLSHGETGQSDSNSFFPMKSRFFASSLKSANA